MGFGTWLALTPGQVTSRGGKLFARENKAHSGPQRKGLGSAENRSHYQTFQAR
jgi:hypothetical protein